MKYDEYRNKIKTGDLLIWSSSAKGWNGFKLNLIKWATKSEYTHVGMAWVTNGRVFILEAVSSGIAITPLSKHVPCYLVPMKMKVADLDMEFAFSKIGEKYSNIQAIMGFLGTLTAGEDDLWQCAEYVKTIYTKKDQVWAGIDATPKAIVDFAMANYDTSLILLEK